MNKMLNITDVWVMRGIAGFLHDKGFSDEVAALAETIKNVVLSTGEPQKYFNEYFGVCPECGDTDGYITVENHHFFVCHEHRIAWYAGQSIFEGDPEPTPEQTENQRKLILSYRVIKMSEAVSDKVCPCCGSCDEHEQWCVMYDSASGVGAGEFDQEVI